MKTKIDNKQMASILRAGRASQLEKKLKDGTLTFDDCGLEKDKNVLKDCSEMLIDDEAEIEDYAVNLCHYFMGFPSAVFLIFNDMTCAFAIRFTFDDWDYFKLDDTWMYSNFVSMVEEFKLKEYGVLYEQSPGVWKTLMD